MLASFVHTYECTHEIKHNFKEDKTLLVISIPPNIPWSRGLQHRVTAVSGHLSLTDWVLCCAITTLSPHDILGPGEHATMLGTTQTWFQSSFCTYMQRGTSSRAWVVKVYFWMYSLHSERVAVGARQLWRQRVIVARQPDRPKMAELTGTGAKASFTLAHFGKLSPLIIPSTHLMMIIYTTETTIQCNCWHKTPTRAQKGREKKVGDLKYYCCSDLWGDSLYTILAIAYSSTKK